MSDPFCLRSSPPPEGASGQARRQKKNPLCALCASAVNNFLLFGIRADPCHPRPIAVAFAVLLPPSALRYALCALRTRATCGTYSGTIPCSPILIPSPSPFMARSTSAWICLWSFLSDARLYVFRTMMS